MDNDSVFDFYNLTKKTWPEAWQRINIEVVLFCKIEEQLKESLVRIASEHQLLEAEYQVLFHLRVFGLDKPQSPTTLYTAIGMTSGGFTKVLKRLESNLCITRIPNPEDGRSSLVRITEKGVELAQRILFQVLEEDDHYLAALTTDERSTLRSLCEKLIRYNNVPVQEKKKKR